MSIKSILLVTTIIYIWTSNGANSYRTYNNRYTVASTSGASSGQLPDDNHPNDIITIEESNEGIPMDEFKKFNNISTLEEFYQMFGDGEEQQTDLPYDSLTELGTNLGRSSVLIPPKAKCEPRDTVVDIVPPGNGPTQRIYFPGCVIAKRCSGCCSPKELMSCQPDSVSYINYAIVVSDYDPKSGHTKIRPKREIFSLEQHDSCSCKCTVKEEDCIPGQSYDPHNCRCVCSNVEAKEKCERNNDKIWVPQNCTCRCRNQAICTSGTVFDENTCACSANRRNRIVSPILVDPATNTQYTVGG